MASILTALFYYWSIVGIIFLIISVLFPITKIFLGYFWIVVAVVLVHIESLEYKKGTRGKRNGSRKVI